MRRLAAPVAVLASLATVAAACGGDAGDRIAELHRVGANTAEENTGDANTGGEHGDVPTDRPVRSPSSPPDRGPIGTSAAFMPTACPFEIEVELTVTCGVVEVPEARDDRTSATVELAVAILRTPADDPAPDPVLYLAGGPGGVSLAEHFIWSSGTDDWRDHPILSRRDMILVDQRGTGYSRPSLWCDDHGGETPEDCHRRLVDAGVDLSSYSTRESAADLAELRLALGLDHWNLYGSSYGTRLALTALRDHPEGIRSLVLEGVYPPDVVPAYHEYVDHALRALDELAAACASDAACAARFGDIGDLLVTALQAADDTPGSPADALDLMDLLFGSLYIVEGVLDAPLALRLAADGRIDAAVDVLLEGAGWSRRTTPGRSPTGHDSLRSGDPTEDSGGLFHSIECREEIAFTDLDVIERRADELFEAGVDELVLEVLIAGIAYPIEQICPWWESGVADPYERRPVVSDTPVLLLSGRFDPITPPEWGDRAATTLSRSTHVVAPNLSHSLVLEDPCIDEIVGMFLDDVEAAPDTSCVAAMRLPAFTLD